MTPWKIVETAEGGDMLVWRTNPTVNVMVGGTDEDTLAAAYADLIARCAVSLPEEARCELCHDAIEQNEACVLDPTGDRWHLCNRFGVDCWEYANTPLPSAPAVSLELPEPPVEEREHLFFTADLGRQCWCGRAHPSAPSTEPPIEDAGSGGVR